MSTVLLKILNMSIAASWLIAVVILVRLFLKKAPKWISCVLWALVALRLLIPFSFESSLSLLPSGETISYKTVALEAPAADPAANAAEPSQTPSGGRTSQSRILVIDTGIPALDDTLNPALERSQRNRQTASAEDPALQNEPVVSAKPARISRETWMLIAVVVWITGLIGLLVYALITYLKLRIKTSASIRLRGNIWASDELKTPFILGIVKPVVYVPSSLGGDELEYVLAHEEAHLRRRDHWWKPLGYLLLAVYWFNPLCWLAYILLCRDIEAACDEKAIKEMNRDEVASYSQTLLNLSVQRRQIAACPLAFGEVGVKQRIKGILNYKKPAFWVILVALVACIVVGVCFLTNPKKNVEPAGSDTETTESVTEATQEPTQAPTQEPTEPATEPSDEQGEKDPAPPKVVVLGNPEVLFTIPVNQDEDSLSAQIVQPMDPTPGFVPMEKYEFGPDAFAVRSENEVLILDYKYKVLRVRNGKTTEVLMLDSHEIGQLLDKLLLHEDDVYVPGTNGILRWNLPSGECTFFPGNLSYQRDDLGIYDFVWDDGPVIVNGKGENLKLDEKTGAFEETKDGYAERSYTDPSTGTNTVKYTMDGQEWNVPVALGFSALAGRGPENSIFTVSTMWNEGEGKNEYYLFQYMPEDTEWKIGLKFPYDTEPIWYSPKQNAYVGTHGVYTLLVEKDVAKVVKYIDFEYEEGQAPEDPTDAEEGKTFSEDAFYTRLENGTLIANMFSWYFEHEYNGEKVQVLPNKAEPSGDGYGNTPRTFAGAVYYRADQGESFAEALYKMQEAICGVYTAEENRARNGYVMTDYRIYPPDSYPNQKDEDENLAEAGQDVWTVRSLYIYYKYEGKCFGATFEQQKEDAGPLWTDENGLILAFGDGSENVNRKVIVKQGDVYMLAAPAYFARHREHKPDLGESAFIKKLRETNPEVFEVDTTNGLMVAVAKFAENDYKCTLISGGRPWVLFTEVAGRDYTFYSPEEMMEILETYSLKDSEILVRYYQHPLSSWIIYPGEEKKVLEKISAQFNDRFGTGIVSVVDVISEYRTKAPDSVRLDLTFDQMLSKGVALNPNVLDSFKAYLSEGKDEGEVLPWGFLCQTYKDPSEIDLGLLFYSKGTESEVSQEEGQAAWTQAGWTDSMWAEPKKVTIQGVREVIAGYTNFEVTEAQLQAFRSWIYVPEYDAYYAFPTDMPDNIRTDTLLRGCTLERAAIEELGIPVNADAVTAIEWSAPERPGAEAMTGMILFSTEGSEPKILANILLK